MLSILKNKLRELKNHLIYTRYWFGTDWSNLECLVIFMGNPRSGTTLIRSIINAHPEAIIGNEVHILRLLRSNSTWKQIIEKICMNVFKFNANPVWTDYSYKVPGTNPKRKTIRVVGDKRSAGTVHALMEYPGLSHKLLNICPVPIKIIRCVRNPYDVISTRTIRNGLSLTENIDRYFEIELNAGLLALEFKPTGIHYVYHEDLIEKPEQTAKALFSFLNLDAPESLLQSCISMLYKTPNLSRHKIEWKEEDMLKAEQAARNIPHLNHYLVENLLVFK